jgi:hypothetical protein
MTDTMPPQYPIYTIGHKRSYLRAIAESDNGTIIKLGKSNNRPGGYAFLTYEDAERRIEEAYAEREYAVFGLKAHWKYDTEPSPIGWWHNLLRDAEIIVLEDKEE